MVRLGKVDLLSEAWGNQELGFRVQTGGRNAGAYKVGILVEISSAVFVIRSEYGGQVLEGTGKQAKRQLKLIEGVVASHGGSLPKYIAVESPADLDAPIAAALEGCQNN